MKTKILLALFLPIIFILITSSGPSTTPAWEKENVSFPMMNQEIRHSMQENDRQKKMKQWQDTNLATENLNKKQWLKFKETTNKIQDRLRIVDFAMQAIPTGYAIFLEGQHIKDTQLKIINEIQTAPYYVVLILPDEVKFVDDLQMVVRLLTGIVVSYGAINQMEKKERKILLNYALGEVQQLKLDSDLMLMKIRNIKQKIEWTKFLFKYYVNTDIEIITDIMKEF
jgi:hypothetical protein